MLQNAQLNTPPPEMKGIVRLKARWTDRKSAMTAAPLPADNCSTAAAQQRYEDIQALHPVPDSICARCRGLHIGSVLEEEGKVEYGTIISITAMSIDSSCPLCRQFHTIFSVIQDNHSLPICPDRFHLSRQSFQILDHRGLFDGTQLGISFPISSRNIRLLPLDGKFKTSRPTTNWSSMSLARDLALGLDLDMIRSMLGNCRQEHGSDCQPVSPNEVVLRLIDCKTRRIVQATSGQQYICLSYVWGSNHALAHAHNRDWLEVVPKTVEDAMFVAINLDIPFLWVDRYCIDQHNSEEKHDIVRKMDRIYKGAQLTIIASVGENPDYGLPGVRGTPRQTQPKLCGDIATYVAVESVVSETLRSTWNSRGWYVGCKNLSEITS